MRREGGIEEGCAQTMRCADPAALYPTISCKILQYPARSCSILRRSKCGDLVGCCDRWLDAMCEPGYVTVVHWVRDGCGGEVHMRCD